VLTVVRAVVTIVLAVFVSVYVRVDVVLTTSPTLASGGCVKVVTGVVTVVFTVVVGFEAVMAVQLARTVLTVLVEKIP
jgi:hypothetical protein